MSESVYEELIGLGAPRLPDGYVYEITPSSDAGKVDLWIVKAGAFGQAVNGSLVINIWILKNRTRMMKKLARRARWSYYKVRHLIDPKGETLDYIGRHP